MRKSKLEKIVGMFHSGKDFSFTLEQYVFNRCRYISQSKSYTEKNSAIAKKATEYNYEVKVVPEVIKFIKQ